MSTVKELIQYKEFAAKHLQGVIAEHEAKLKELGAGGVFITVSQFRNDKFGEKPSVCTTVQVEVTL